MRVLVCGAGEVGYHVADHLARLGHDVTVIDRSPRLVRRISDLMEVRAIEGHASDPAVLERAQAADADLLIAVTALDEVNLVACQVARALFDVSEVIARVRNPSYLQPRWQRIFGADPGFALSPDRIISPEAEVAAAIFASLEVPGATLSLRFAEGRVRVLGLHLGEDCPVVETPLRQLTELFPDLAVRVMAVEREGRLRAVTSDDQLLVGDSIYIAVHDGQVDRALAAFGIEAKPARDLIIVGGGEVGVGLARLMERHRRDVHVKIIEKDEERAAFAADQVSRSVVLNGDALQIDVLQEAGIENADTLVAVTNLDQANILACLLARHLGRDIRTLALITREAFAPLVHEIGIDVRVDPRAITISSILRHIRRGGIRQVRTIADGRGEILEVRLLDHARIVHKRIREAGLPQGVVIGAIVRGDETLIARPDTPLEAGDSIIVFAERDAVRALENLLMVDAIFY